MKLKDVTAEKWEFIIDHPEKQAQGIHLWYKGIPFPLRMYYDRLNDPNHNVRVLEALGTVKKFLFSLTHLSKVVIPTTLNIKKWEVFLNRIYWLCWWQLSPYLLKDDEWSVPVWEMGKIIKNFLLALGLQEDIAIGFSKIGMCVLEFDLAYRYRIQDLIGAVSPAWWYDTPLRSIRIMQEVYKERESLAGASEKLNKLFTFRYLFLLPKLRKAWIKAMDGIELGKIKFDDNDRFHFAFWKGYDYEGKDFEHRFKPYEEAYKKAPFVKRQDPQLTAEFITGN